MLGRGVETAVAVRAVRKVGRQCGAIEREKQTRRATEAARFLPGVVYRDAELVRAERSTQFRIAGRTHAHEVKPVLLEEIGSDKPLENDSRCFDSDARVSNHLAYGNHIAGVHPSEHRLEPCPGVRIGCGPHAPQ